MRAALILFVGLTFGFSCSADQETFWSDWLKNSPSHLEVLDKLRAEKISARSQKILLDYLQRVSFKSNEELVSVREEFSPIWRARLGTSFGQPGFYLSHVVLPHLKRNPRTASGEILKWISRENELEADHILYREALNMVLFPSALVAALARDLRPRGPLIESDRPAYDAAIGRLPSIGGDYPDLFKSYLDSPSESGEAESLALLENILKNPGITPANKDKLLLFLIAASGSEIEARRWTRGLERLPALDAVPAAQDWDLLWRPHQICLDYLTKRGRKFLRFLGMAS